MNEHVEGIAIVYFSYIEQNKSQDW